MSNRWSYQVIEMKPGLLGGFKGDAIQAELARQGSLGWELVQILVPAPLTPAQLVFKKPA